MTKEELTERVKEVQDDINGAQEVAALIADDIQEDIYSYEFDAADRRVADLSRKIGELKSLVAHQKYVQGIRDMAEDVEYSYEFHTKTICGEPRETHPAAKEAI